MWVPSLIFQGAGILGGEFILHFVLNEIIEFPPQLSYSVNAVAVRGDVCWPARRGGSNRTIAPKEKTSVPKERPYES